MSWAPPKAPDRQVYQDDIGWGMEWFVQYGPNEIDRYGDGLDEGGALLQWHRIHTLGLLW